MQPLTVCEGRALSQTGAGFSQGPFMVVLCGWQGHGPCTPLWAQALSKLTVGPADNHDIISMKLFQLMVEHTPDEENIDWTKIEPSVNFLKSPKDNVDDPTGNFRGGPLTGWRVFLLLLCALLGIIVCAVVGAVVFQKRQDRNKRFY